MTDDRPPHDDGDVAKRIRQAWDADSPSGWFEGLYADAQKGETAIPWAMMEASPQLVDWLDRRSPDGADKRALVVGCGLGDDAEELARRGFNVTAFDIAETAIAWARERFPDSSVHYAVSDLFGTPEAWRGAFDLVVEIRTIQAMPHTLADQAIDAIAGFVKAGGTALIVCHGREPHEEKHGIPWRLSRTELARFIDAGLTEIEFQEEFTGGKRRFCIEYQRSST